MHLETLAPALSFISIGIGIPNQIYRLHKMKTANEVPILNWIFGLVTFTVWALYARELHNSPWFWMNVLGFGLSLIVVGQIIYYRWIVREIA